MIREKIEFYFDKQIVIHLEKKDGQWFNGLIIEKADDHIILLDRVILKEVFIPVDEIIKIEPYKERGVK